MYIFESIVKGMSFDLVNKLQSTLQNTFLLKAIKTSLYYCKLITKCRVLISHKKLHFGHCFSVY